MEAVLLSVTPSYVGIKLQEGKQEGKDLQVFKDNIDRPLAAILTLITFAHTLGAAGVGAQAQIIWGEEYLTLISTILTLIILILSEIIPKTLGANYWQQLTPFTVKALKVMIYSPLYPIIVLSQFITRWLKSDKERSVLSRADFTAMAEIGMKEGIFRDEESKIITNLLQFNRIQVKHIMTPRTVVEAAPEEMKVMEYFEQRAEFHFSRIPIYQENIDQITGYVLKDDILTQLVKGQGESLLKEISRPIIVVPINMPIPELFNRIMKDKNHIALVTDEYGGTNGIVTAEDIIETLLGMEIMDEMDKIEDMQLFARESCRRKTNSRTP